MRLRLALAALPLAAAVVLFVVTGSGSGSDPASESAQDSATAEDVGIDGSGFEGAPLVPGLAPGALEATLPSDVTAAAQAADTAAVAGTPPDHALDGDGAGGDGVGGHDADAAPVPTAPTGHRPVAVRITDPAALSLVRTGDHVDVVGMDGSVLAERLEILQDRSSGTGPVLVLAVPDAKSAALAAAALSREVTVILSGDPAAQGTVP